VKEKPGWLSILPSNLSDYEYCVLDVETSGINPDQNRLTEIGACIFKGQVMLDQFESLVNAGVQLSPSIVKITGITNELLSDAPPEHVVIGQFKDFVGNRVLIGHNLRFDLAFLNQALIRHDMEPLTNQTIDTLALSRYLLRGQVPNYKLATLAECLALPQPSHRAISDVTATARLFQALAQLNADRAANLAQRAALHNQPIHRRPNGIVSFRSFITKLLG
jgi:DNA polymerase-3 subunit epsilon